MACADFEAMNVPIQSATPDARKSYENKLTNQRATSYSWYLHSDYEHICKNGFKLYRSTISSENIC